jgi:hypothetical protein
MLLAFTHALCQVREFFAVRALLQWRRLSVPGTMVDSRPGHFCPPMNLARWPIPRPTGSRRSGKMLGKFNYSSSMTFG